MVQYLSDLGCWIKDSGTMPIGYSSKMCSQGFEIVPIGHLGELW
jgi:hypothetical protein